MSEPETRKIHVFISHKHEDRAVAKILNHRLQTYGNGKVSCFISEGITPSDDWFHKIKENLAKADILILLFTATHATWDWPLYEVGLATNLDDNSPCKIVCLYPPDEQPPDPIKFAQAVKADEEGVEGFLYRFLCTPEITGFNPPINPTLADDRTMLKELAIEVARGFTCVQPWKNYFTNVLWMIVDEGKIEESGIPDDAWINAESTGLKLFGLAPNHPRRGPWTWADLKNRANREQDEAWKTALNERFYWASRGENLKSMTETFESLQSQQLFRPLVNRIELRTDGSLLFEVIMIEHLPGTD